MKLAQENPLLHCLQKHVKLPVSFVLTLVVCSTCITRLDIEPSDFEDYLVVEGFINNEPGPHRFRITRVSRFSGVLDGGAILTEEAEVTITDQNGLSVPLRRKAVTRKDIFNADPMGCSPGVLFVQVQTNYLAPEGFHGEVGNTYTLEIQTTDGKIYRSEPQTMRHTPPLDSLHLSFKKLPSLDPVVIPSGVEIFAIWQDPPGEDNYYSWIVNGIYRINTSDRGDACCLFDPNDGGAGFCWILENDLPGNESAFPDSRVNGQRITVPIGFIEDDGIRFASDLVPANKLYYIEVEQYAITKEAFEFNERIKTLAEIDGEIFDPPPVGVRGNIYNIADPDEIVIGHFGAYEVQKKDIFLDASMLEFRQRFPRPCGDCRVRAGAQLETPGPYQ